ncbi:acylneuraminate cytidylyltransferase family protein [Vreelandella sulfidaeris]
MSKSNREIDTLAIIPARGGSKRLPRKNVLPLAGKPLIQWSIDEAIKADSIDLIVVTSDDDEVLGIADEYKSQNVISIKRPPELSSDIAKSVDAVKHALLQLSKMGIYPNQILLLQPTSPLRKACDIQGAIDFFENEKADNVISVCELEHPSAWCGMISEDRVLHGFDLSVSRSQEARKEYRINGAIYVVNRLAFMSKGSMIFEKPKTFVMPQERSIDIDTYFDFKMCEAFMLIE